MKCVHCDRETPLNAVVSMKLFDGGIRLDVVGDLSEVVWVIENVNRPMTINPGNCLIIDICITDDDKLQDMQQGEDPLLAKQSRRVLAIRPTRKGD